MQKKNISSKNMSLDCCNAIKELQIYKGNYKMSQLADIIKKCSWKISQENNERHYLRCYNCNGFIERAKEINCPYFTLKNIYHFSKKEISPSIEYRHD